MDENPISQVNAIQRAQAGVIHARQVRDAGLSHGQVARRLASGGWTERHPSVYVASGAPDTFDARCFAALLAVRYAGRRGMPRRAAVAGLSAAFAHDLGVPEPERVHLVVPFGDGAPALDGVDVVRARTWPDRVFTSSNGLVVTGVADTIVDVAWYVGRDRLHAIVQEAAFARPGLEQAVLRACRRGRTGSAAARRAAALVLAGVDSSLHRRGRALARRAGLPKPECGAEVAAGAGPSDCVFRVGGAVEAPFGLVVEWDGDAHRVDRQTFLHDREKDRLVRRAGYVTVRYTFEQVTRGNVVVDDLRAEWRALTARSVHSGERSHAS